MSNEPVTFEGLKKRWRAPGAGIISSELDEPPKVENYYDAGRFQCADELELLEQRVRELREQCDPNRLGDIKGISCEWICRKLTALLGEPERKP